MKLCPTRDMEALQPLSDALYGLTGVAVNPLMIIVTILAIVIVGVVTMAGSSKSKAEKKGNSVLVLGTVGSGKTALFFQLRDGKYIQTFTSMKENEADVLVAPSMPKLKLVDIPGHKRLRYLVGEKLSAARGIIFVVDSTTINLDVSNIADFLYDLFTRNDFPVIPVLIFCNKMDFITAARKDKVKSAIEKELEQLRKSRGSMLDESAGENVLGLQGEVFKMEHAPCPVSFGEGSVKSGELECVQEFFPSLVGA